MKLNLTISISLKYIQDTILLLNPQKHPYFTLDSLIYTYGKAMYKVLRKNLMILDKLVMQKRNNINSQIELINHVAYLMIYTTEQLATAQWCV